MGNSPAQVTFTRRVVTAPISGMVEGLRVRVRSDGFLEFVSGIRGGYAPSLRTDDFIDFLGNSAGSGQGLQLGLRPIDDFMTINARS